jgi:ABC-type transport system involved in multi-copper enzyme maturation permease subunit
MQATATLNLLWHFNPLRLAGPISDKELRVASRRGLSYALRSGYVLLLCILMLSGWYGTVGLQSGQAVTFSLSRAAELSTFLTSRIIWFQFVAAQVVAAIMLSFSMSDELRRGTLSTLMTTPIRSAHIVAGKLLSGLLQIVLLLAVSLPVLAILRVQGGVPWGLVVAGFCVTLTSAAFAAALGLFLATRYRHPYQAISAVAAVYFIIFCILPAVKEVLDPTRVSPRTLSPSIIDLMNPFLTLFRAVPLSGSGSSSLWPIHCIAMSSVTLILLSFSVRRVRGAAAQWLPARTETEFVPITRVYGSPLVWKDTGGKLLPWRCEDIALAVVALGLCGLMAATNSPQTVNYGFYLAYIPWGLWLLMTVRLTISVAGGVTREKEGGTWPLLLTTPLDDKQIVRGKIRAALRQNAIVVLSALAVQILRMFTFFGPSRPSYLVFALVSLVVTLFFIISAGLYFGVRLRTTVVAAAATLGAYLCLNYVVGRLLTSILFRLLWNPIARTDIPSIRMTLLSFAPASGLLILELVLGVLLLRQARRNVRQYVF